MASIVGLFNTLGIVSVSPLIGKYGRRSANLVSAILMVIGWLCIVLASGTATILFARSIQGIGLGISSLTSAILIGEFTDPKYRGAFLTMMTTGILIGVLIVHTLGSYLHWTNTAICCLIIAIIDSILVMLSPESPVFLASREKYDECRKVFRWLRGSEDEEELEAMIKYNMLTNRKIKRNFKDKLRNTLQTFKKPAFYKPLIIMLHLYWCNVLSGAFMIDVYGLVVYHSIIGDDISITVMLVSVDILKIASGLFASFLNINVRRRLMIMIFINLNILAYFIIAAYYYAKLKQWLIFDHPYVSVALLYFLVFTEATGTMTIVNTIAGEIFPMKYKNVSATVTTLIMCLSVAMHLKTLPYLLSTLDIHGTFCLYGILMIYCVVVSLTMVPETKDLTLQNIEETYWQGSLENSKKLEEQRELVKKENSKL